MNEGDGQRGEIYMEVDIVIVGFEMDVLLDTLVGGR